MGSGITAMRVFAPKYSTAANAATTRGCALRVGVVFWIVLLHALLGHGQTSELYLLYSPNTIDPVGMTYVYQGGRLLRSWGHAGPYEIALAAVGGTVRQGAVFTGFSGSEYTQAGLPTGRHYPAAPYVFDAGSDGTWIYGWHVDSATLTRYDLDWKVQTNLFSLGANYSYAYMGITYDAQNGTIWLAPLSTGPLSTAGNLYNYSLNGKLLRTLKLAESSETCGGLAYDSADDTLWVFNWGPGFGPGRLEQYSKAGGLLSTIEGISRIYGLEFAVVADSTPPTISISTSRTILWPPTGNLAPVRVKGRIMDERGGSGIKAGTAAYAVTDEYGQVQPAGPIELQSDGSYAFVVLLQAARHGTDLDGREYIITVVAQDHAGNTGVATTSVTVPHDKEGPGPKRPYVY